MKSALLIILSNYSIFCYSQVVTNYIDYHQQCRKAEEWFLKDSVEKSFVSFNEAFNKFEILFPRDCFMAAQIAHKSNYDSLAIEYLLFGMEFGLNPEIINSNGSYLNDLKSSVYWNKVEVNKDSLSSIYRQKVNWDLKNEIMLMTRQDQDWRVKNNKWFNRKFRKSSETKFKRFNKSQMNYLDSIFSTHGYPGSWLIGIGDSLSHLTEYASFNNANLSGIPSAILYHHDSTYLKYGKFLLNEISNGHIHPRTYAIVRDFNDRYFVKNNKDQKMYYNIWWERENFSKKEMEQHCQRIGCPTKQHLRLLNQKFGAGYDVFWYPFR